MTNNFAAYVAYGIIPIFEGDHGREYLLLQNNGGYWGFPKGHAEPGEEPKDTAIREALEETGIRIDSSEIDFFVEYTYEQPIDGKMQTKRIVLFPTAVASKDVTLQSSEIRSHQWVGYEEVIALVNLPDIAQALQRIENKKA